MGFSARLATRAGAWGLMNSTHPMPPYHLRKSRCLGQQEIGLRMGGLHQVRPINVETVQDRGQTLGLECAAEWGVVCSHPLVVIALRWLEMISVYAHDFSHRVDTACNNYTKGVRLRPEQHF